MNKKDRQIVFNKFGGRCAYCGCELKNGWQLDHVEPVNRINKYKEGHYRHKVTKQKIKQEDLPDRWYEDYERINSTFVFDKMLNPERDTIENSMPACGSCNSYKHSMSLESFRENVGLLIGRLNQSFNQYKIAKRFGLVEETNKPVLFYFEIFSQNS